MAHPSRRDLAESLSKQLRAPVSYDPDPEEERNPWRCARQAWKVGAAKPGATHVLVVQEDCIPCPDFRKHVGRALRAKPDRVASFFLGWLPAQTAQLALSAVSRCAAWQIGSHAGWCPTIALAMPLELADGFWRFEDGTRPVADDDVAGRYLRSIGVPWYASLPSLVDHDDEAPSLMSTEARNRQAMCYAGDADLSRVDWHAD